jgi:hypothetical protein
MNNLIQRIVNAQIRQEGAGPGALNPGNLRGAPWLVNPVIENGFWVPGSRQEGLAGLAHEVALHVAEGQSLTEYITGYAPPGDGNDTAAYIAHVSEWAGIPDVTVPMWTYIAG